MIYERFKEERERLGFTQPQIGGLAGASKNTVLNWERGASSPTAVQLEQLEKVGMDTHYVITGDRKGISDDLAADEQLLIDTYRSLPITERRKMLAALLAGEGQQASKIINSGKVKVGTQINADGTRLTINGDYNENS